MTQNTKDQTSYATQDSSYENPYVLNIQSILSTGHPIASSACFSELVIMGERARQAFDYLKQQLNGDYFLLDLSESAPIPDTTKQIVAIRDSEHMTEDSIEERIIFLINQKNARVITIHHQNYPYQSPRWPYHVRAEDLLKEE